MTSYTKDPGSELDYLWDWKQWLETGDRITSHTVVADPGITVASSSHTDTAVTVWLDGGVLGQTYRVTVTVETLGGRTDERTLTFLIRNR